VARIAHQRHKLAATGVREPEAYDDGRVWDDHGRRHSVPHALDQPDNDGHLPTFLSCHPLTMTKLLYIVCAFVMRGAHITGSICHEKFTYWRGNGRVQAGIRRDEERNND